MLVVILNASYLIDQIDLSPLVFGSFYYLMVLVGELDLVLLLTRVCILVHELDRMLKLDEVIDENKVENSYMEVDYGLVAC